MNGHVRSQFRENFRIAAKQTTGRHRGAPWNDGDTYKWIEACSAAYGITHDPQLLKTIDASVREIVAAQRDDGYLHTPVQIANLIGDSSKQPFGDPVDFEMYNLGHLMTAATVHFENTGDRILLDAAIRAADFLDQEFSAPTQNVARHAVCPSHYMGVIDLYRATGDQRYLKLAERWMDMRDLVIGGGDDNQDRIPFRDQRQIVGHAVRANYLMAGAADLYLENGDQTLLPALKSCWADLVGSKLYITGGCGALFDGASPDGSENQKTITRIHQAYGRPFQLPNSTAHNESCAAIGSILWNSRMLQITGEAKYADLLETTLMNAVLGSVSLDGTRYFYTNTLRQLNHMPTDLRWSREREEWISCYCCPPNIVRTIAQCQSYAWLARTDSADLTLYGSNHLSTTTSRGEKLEIIQTTNYPSSGTVELKLVHVPEGEFTLRLRWPGWCSEFEVSINGHDHPIARSEDGWVILRRRWKPGDEIRAEMKMPVRLMEAHPLIEECLGQVAVQRGPLVYCLESHDLPTDVSLHDVRVDSDTEWTLVEGTEVLKSVPLIEGHVRYRSSQSVSEVQSSDDPSELYRPLARPAEKTIPVRFVPYFAWGNRGKSEMSVWLLRH